MVGSIALTASEVESNLEFPETWDRERRVQFHAIAEEDVVGLTFREPREDSFGWRGAVRGKAFADECADSDDGSGGIDAVETDDTAGAGNGGGGG